jgi:hypothetical protein
MIDMSIVDIYHQKVGNDCGQRGGMCRVRRVLQFGIKDIQNRGVHDCFFERPNPIWMPALPKPEGPLFGCPTFPTSFLHNSTETRDS